MCFYTRSSIIPIVNALLSLKIGEDEVVNVVVKGKKKKGDEFIGQNRFFHF